MSTNSENNDSYYPVKQESIISVLEWTRIGEQHSVVFVGLHQRH